MFQLPNHIENLIPYQAGRSGLSQEDSKEWISLCSNENNLGPSPLAVDAMRQVLSQVHQYPDPVGSQLRQAIGYKNNINANQIFLGNGSEGIIYTLFKAYFLPGDRILTSEGTFSSVEKMAAMHQVEVVKVPLTESYEFDLKAILNRLDTTIKAIYVCNPNNPTGTLIRAKELRDFCQQIPTDVLIIVDEAYFEYAQFLDAEYPDSTEWNLPNLITLRTFSKAYGLAGLRIGYVMGSPDLIEPLYRVKVTFNPGILAMEAAEAALQDEQHLRLTLASNARGLRQCYNCFDQLGYSYIHSFANFVMLDLDSESQALALVNQLRDRGILIRHLAGFGLSHCVRFSIGTAFEMDRLFQALAELEDLSQDEGMDLEAKIFGVNH